MATEVEERPGGDVNYGVATRATVYAHQRRADPRIAALLHAALGDARVVLNVGAGTGSYEPEDRTVIAVEPSAAMRAQRPPHLAAALDAVAEQLPLESASVDTSMAIATVHQWRDLRAGLRELLRVTRGPLLLVTFDGDALGNYWVADHVPELIAAERARFPLIADLRAALGAGTEVCTVPIPIDCTDGFVEAFYARPEQLLDERVHRAQSAWQFVAPDVIERFVERLRADLESGAWDERYGTLRRQPTYEGSLKLVVRRVDQNAKC